MPNEAQKARFHQRFTSWLGNNGAASESPAFETALAISDYVNEANDSAKIQKELVNGSRIYRKLSDLHHKLTKGSALFAKFTIEDYFQHATANEKVHLKIIQKKFKELYQKPMTNTAENVSQLLQNTQAWLDDEMQHNDNVLLVKSTLLSLYTVLTIFQIKLNNLNIAQRFILNRFLNKDKLQLALQKLQGSVLLNLTNRLEATPAPIQLNEGEPMAAAAAVNDANVDELEPGAVPESEEGQILPSLIDDSQPKSQTLKDYIDTHCHHIIALEGPTLNEKIAMIKEVLLELQTKLKDLIVIKEQITGLQQHIAAAMAISSSVDSNENITFGRQYAGALIEQHQDNLNAILSYADSDLRATWENICQPQNNDLAQQAKAGGLYLLSLAAVPFKAVIPAGVQKTVAQLGPETRDSVLKDTLRALANSSLPRLQIELAQLRQTQATLAQQLFGDHPGVMPLVSSATLIELKELDEATDAAHHVMNDFGRLSTMARDEQIKLQELELLDTKINAFLNEHDGFFVKLSLFFAQLWSIFKTDTAAKVEEIREYKEQLLPMKMAFESSVAKIITSIDGANVTREIKQIIIEKLSFKEALPPKEDNPLEPEFIPAYQHVRTLFSQLKPAALKMEEEVVAYPALIRANS